MNAYSRRFRPTRGPNPQNSVWFRTAVKDRLLVEGDRQDVFRCAGTPRSPPCLSLERHDWKTSRGDEEDATFSAPPFADGPATCDVDYYLFFLLDHAMRNTRKLG